MLFSKSTGLAIALAFAGAQNSTAKPLLKGRGFTCDPSDPNACDEGLVCMSQEHAPWYLCQAIPSLSAKRQDIDPAEIVQQSGQNCPIGDMGIPDCTILSPPVLNTRQFRPCTPGTSDGCAEGWLCSQGDMGISFCEPPVERRDSINARQDMTPCESSSDCGDGEICFTHDALGSYCTSFDTTHLPRRSDEIDTRQSVCGSNICPEGWTCLENEMGASSCMPSMMKERRQLPGCAGGCPEGEWCYSTMGASACLPINN